jgi:hypothetical protein
MRTSFRRAALDAAISLFAACASLAQEAPTRVGGEFRVNVHTASHQGLVDVAMDASGAFVAVWRSHQQDGSAGGVFGRRFDSTGAPQGSEFLVHSHTALEHFVIVWTSSHEPSFGIFGKRFSSAGSALGPEFQVHTYVTGVQADTEGPDLQVNTETLGEQYIPAVAGDADGDFVVAWWSPGTEADMLAQRFDTPILYDVDGNGQFDALTDGLSILRFGFGFTGVTLITGAVGPGCTRRDAPSITAYLQSFL